jgi:hypothetical protein
VFNYGSNPNSVSVCLSIDFNLIKNLILTRLREKSNLPHWIFDGWFSQWRQGCQIFPGTTYQNGEKYTK